MKFSLPAFLGIAIFGASGAAGSSLRGNDDGHRVLEADVEGAFLVADIQYDPADGRRNLQGNGNRPDRTLNIELPDGIYEIKNAQAGWADDLVSGASVVKIPKGAIKKGASIDVQGGKPSSVRPFDRKTRSLLEEDDGEYRTPEQQRNLDELRRQLAVVTGTKTVLAARVIHGGGASTTALSRLDPSYSKEVLADDVFGPVIGGSDAVGLHTQYLACSHGKLDFQPAAPRSSGNAAVTAIVNGVVEVTVNTACSGTCDGQMRNDVNNALSTAFGTSASNLANHVMHCLPPGAMSGIAYAYINSWNSVYSDNWCRYTSTQLHEIGHNLNLAHANEGSQTYDDRSGFMGYSYAQDDQKMCFNNAKNWQLGWFSDESQEIGLAQAYVGNLKGQVNYGNGDNDSKVVIKVKDPGSNLAYYIGYNHRVKHNSQTNEAGNLVTIQQYSGSGYSASVLIGKLGSGATWSLVLGSETVNVEVGTITTNQDTGLAPVTITYGTVVPTEPPVTSAPTTPSPTTSPTTPFPTTSPTTPFPTTSPTTPAPTTSPVTSAPTTCSRAKVDESCVDGADCCSGLCSGGKKADRVCLANGPTPPTTPQPTPAPVLSPPTTPQPVGTCLTTGSGCAPTDTGTCCNGCSNGNPLNRVCL